jgi:hypothetical protein
MSVKLVIVSLMLFFHTTASMSDCDRLWATPGRQSSALIREVSAAIQKHTGRRPCDDWSPATVMGTLANVSKERRILVTSADMAYLDFAKNWISSASKFVDNYIVIAESLQVFAALQTFSPGHVINFELEEDLDINTQGVNSTDASHGEVAFESKEYLFAVSRRGLFVWRLLEMGYGVFWSDADVSWLGDPFPCVEPWLERCDILIQVMHASSDYKF